MSFANWGLGTRLYGIFGLGLTLLAAITALAAFNTEGGARQLIVGIGAAGVVIGMLAAWRITLGITQRLQQALEAATRLAAGDLTGSIEASTSDELGQLMGTLQELNERLFRIVSDVRTGTTTVTATSSQINRDNTALSTRTETQASSLEETASSIEELTSTVKLNADNAQQANQLAVSASELASRGGQVVGEVVTTMGSIKESSRKIVDIISVIDGIAFQTNILALNAAVEAARAGEQGRGFAVVASEVRTLAQRSASAAKEIKALISDSVEKVDAGGKLVDGAGKAMTDIVQSVQHIADIIKEISEASREQSAGIESVNQAVTQIDGMTQQNAVLVQDAMKTAVGLNQQALTLLQSVSGFNLGAREYGNEEEAIDLVKRAVAFMQSHGRQALIDDVNKFGKGQFIDRDLYLSLYDARTIEVVGHGNNPRLVGFDGGPAKDTAGKPFIREIVNMGNTKGNGWVDYRFAHPVTNEDAMKNTYLEKCGDLVIACGVYKG